ncbi:class I adenylate-forming enzyme family protein [uncultured Microbulbifer sp.]|uniref:class I adenylate-forming enzyme family protein n=1 Tax=uncultured Microbulbifer sp. TaxID=348147 RepID=UPI00261EEBED|nr:class I adenylate-forming enzyme family protein [uncultured Microbulbifer sp.]
MFSLADLFERVAAKSWHGSVENLSGEKLTAKQCEKAYSILQQRDICLGFGDRLIVKAQSDVFTIAVILAAWQLGLTVVPVKEDARNTAVGSVATDCNAKALFERGKLQLLGTYRSEKKRFKFCSAPRLTGADLALIIYTSGSTGNPKGIMLTHQNVLTALQSITHYLRLTKEDRILCLSPLSFDYGLYQILFALFKECTTVLYNKIFHPIQALQAIDQFNISILPFVPAMGSTLVSLVSVVKPDLSQLRSITNTGGHLSESIIQAWKFHCPHVNIYSMYGLTECKRALYLEPELWEQKMGSVGKPIPGIEAKIFIFDTLDDSYREAEADVIGELYVRGSAVMQAYNDPNVLRETYILEGKYRDDNWLATGDLFSRDKDGFYFFRGRSKDLIKQAGFCLFPKDLENLIDACPLVHLNVVVGSVDKQGNEYAICVVELRKNCPDHKIQFHDWLKQNLDSDYIPREIRFVEAIQLTENNKVDRNYLKKEIQG